MILNVYAIKNELVGAYSGLYLFRSDAVAAVELALAQSTKTPLDECKLYRVGTFDDENCKIERFQPVELDFDTRRLPKEKPIE